MKSRTFLQSIAKNGPTQKVDRPSPPPLDLRLGA